MVGPEDLNGPSIVRGDVSFGYNTILPSSKGVTLQLNISVVQQVQQAEKTAESLIPETVFTPWQIRQLGVAAMVDLDG